MIAPAMKIADWTQFQNDNGIIDIFGRIQGTIRFGLNWYDQMQAQKSVIRIFNKILDSRYVLLRNINLPGTNIQFPLILFGPSGIFIINTIHDHGVFRVRGAEWASASGTSFVPANVNQVQKTIKLARILQIYLKNAGFPNLEIEPVLMSTNPGLHIESIHPAVRVVMSDAIENFATSVNQNLPAFNNTKIEELVTVILKGSNQPDDTDNVIDDSENPFINFDPSTLLMKENDSEATSSSSTQANTIQENFVDENLSKLFYEPYTSELDDPFNLVQSPSENTSNEVETNEFDETTLPKNQVDSNLNEFVFSGTQNKEKQVHHTPKQSGFLGMTKKQKLILGSILVIWLLVIAGFFIYINS